MRQVWRDGKGKGDAREEKGVRVRRRDGTTEMGCKGAGREERIHWGVGDR